MPARVDVKAMRGRMGIGQEELARRIPVGVRSVQRWESGEAQPSPMAVSHLRRVEREHHARQSRSQEPGL